MVDKVIMEFDTKELSSIELYSNTQSINESQFYAIHDILSNLSSITKKPKNHDKSITNEDICCLKTQLEENFKANYDQSFLSENKIPQDIVKEIGEIRNRVQELRFQLKGSEDIIAQKDEENMKLKIELEELQMKSFIAKDKLTVCSGCDLL